MVVGDIKNPPGVIPLSTGRFYVAYEPPIASPPCDRRCPSPALAVPVAAHASACTLPPELIERFLRMRAWFAEVETRRSIRSREHDKRFYAASGVTIDEYRDIKYGHPRREELDPIWSKTWNEAKSESGPSDESEDVETNALTEERWAVAEAMMAHEPQSIVDLAWQLEAWLIADLEMLSGGISDQLLLTFVEHVRTLGAVPQPDDHL